MFNYKYNTMTIDELFLKYPRNIIGFRLNGNTKIIDFWFDVNWELEFLPQEEKDHYELVKVKTNKASTHYYYTISSDKLQFIDLFTKLSSFIEYNLEIEKKKELFNSKLEELKLLFNDLPYDDLKKISFEIQNSDDLIDNNVDVIQDNENDNN